MKSGTEPKVEVDLRVLQANERTLLLLAWIRTGLALMAFGFVVARVGVWLDEGGIAPVTLHIRILPSPPSDAAPARSDCTRELLERVRLT